MKRGVGSVWYDRLSKEVRKNSTVHKYAVVSKKRDLMIGMHRVHGYLVTRVHSHFFVGMTSLIPGVAEEDQLKQAVGNSTSYDEYMKKAESLWNQQKVCV